MSESEIIFCAFRYCLGRSTYVVGNMTLYLLEHWDRIDQGIQSAIIKEIVEAIQLRQAGADIDVTEWKDFLKDLSKRNVDIKPNELKIKYFSTESLD